MRVMSQGCGRLTERGTLVMGRCAQCGGFNLADPAWLELEAPRILPGCRCDVCGSVCADMEILEFVPAAVS